MRRRQIFAMLAAQPNSSPGVLPAMGVAEPAAAYPASSMPSPVAPLMPFNLSDENDLNRMNLESALRVIEMTPPPVASWPREITASGAVQEMTDWPPVKRKGGRPKGSKNRVKRNG